MKKKYFHYIKAHFIKINKYSDFEYNKNIKYKMSIVYKVIGEKKKAKKIFDELLNDNKFKEKNNIKLLLKSTNNFKLLEGIN